MLRIDVRAQPGAGHDAELTALIGEATRADGHEPLGEHKFLRLERGDDRGVALLAFEDGRLAGYGHALTYRDGDTPRVSLELAVHPRFRRRGIGSALLAEAAAYAQRQGAGRIDVWAYNDSPATERIAGGLGFTANRRLLHLHRHVGLSAAPPPPAVRGMVRAFRPGLDADAWLDLNARVFADHPENGGWTREDLRARFDQPWFNPDDFLLLEVDGGLAGFCWLKIDERGDDGRVGEIYVIGIAPEHRGHGLARHLLAAALDHLEARGARVAAIYVDAANRRALRLYQMYGFHHHHVDVCYSLDMRAHALPANRDAAAA
jgi:mycothiol synthase